jgi:hypothetical protein
MKLDEPRPSPEGSSDPARREPAGPVVWGAGKVRPRHLDRVAIVYYYSARLFCLDGPLVADLFSLY